jgi:hypothetical protein
MVSGPHNQSVQVGIWVLCRTGSSRHDVGVVASDWSAQIRKKHALVIAAAEVQTSVLLRLYPGSRARKSGPFAALW